MLPVAAPVVPAHAATRYAPRKPAVQPTLAERFRASDLVPKVVAPPEPGPPASEWGPTTTLPAAIARRFGDAYGEPLDGVRVHLDSPAPKRHRARAVTHGRSVAFAEGAFDPGTPTGMALIAHELAHVAQQALGGRTEAVAAGTDALERDADRAAQAALAGRPVDGLSPAPPYPQLAPLVGGASSEAELQERQNESAAAEDGAPRSTAAAIERLRSTLLGYLEPTHQYYQTGLLRSVAFPMMQGQGEVDGFTLNLLALFSQTFDRTLLGDAARIYAGTPAAGEEVYAAMASFFDTVEQFHGNAIDPWAVDLRGGTSGDLERPFETIQPSATEWVRWLLGQMGVADLFLRGTMKDDPNTHYPKDWVERPGVPSRLSGLHAEVVHRRDALAGLVEDVRALQTAADAYNLVSSFGRPADRDYLYGLMGVSAALVDQAGNTRTVHEHEAQFGQPMTRWSDYQTEPPGDVSPVQWELAVALHRQAEHVRAWNTLVTVVTIGGSIAVTLALGPLAGPLWAGAFGVAVAGLSGAAEVREARRLAETATAANAARLQAGLPLADDAYTRTMQEHLERTQTSAVGNTVVAAVTAPLGGSEGARGLARLAQSLGFAGLDGILSWAVDPRMNDDAFLAELHAARGGSPETAPTATGNLVYTVAFGMAVGGAMDLGVSAALRGLPTPIAPGERLALTFDPDGTLIEGRLVNADAELTPDELKQLATNRAAAASEPEAPARVADPAGASVLPQPGDIEVVALGPAEMAHLGIEDGAVAIRLNPDGTVRDVVHTPAASKTDLDVHVAFAHRLQTWLFEMQLWVERWLHRLQGGTLSRAELDLALKELHKHQDLLAAHEVQLAATPNKAIRDRLDEIDSWLAHWEGVLRGEVDPGDLDVSVIFGRKGRYQKPPPHRDDPMHRLVPLAELPLRSLTGTPGPRASVTIQEREYQVVSNLNGFVEPKPAFLSLRQAVGYDGCTGAYHVDSGAFLLAPSLPFSESAMPPLRLGDVDIPTLARQGGHLPIGRALQQILSLRNLHRIAGISIDNQGAVGFWSGGLNIVLNSRAGLPPTETPPLELRTAIHDALREAKIIP